MNYSNEPEFKKSHTKTIASLIIIIIIIALSAFIAPKFAKPYVIMVSGQFYQCTNKDGNLVITNTDGKSLSQKEIDELFIDSFPLIVYRNDAQYGYIDKTGNVIRSEWEYCFKFSDGLARVMSNGKYGYIDSAGKMVIPTQWNNAEDFCDGIARVGKGNDIDYNGYIDKTGKFIISPTWDSVGKFFGNVARVEKDGCYGYIDRTGKIVVDVKYEFADAEFSDGMARIGIESENDYKLRQYGYINTLGEIVIPPSYYCATEFGEDLAAVAIAHPFFYESSNVWQYIDKNGNIVIPHKWLGAGRFSNGLAPVAIEKSTTQWHFINQKGEIVLSGKEGNGWDSVTSFNDGIACVSNHYNSSWYYIDTNGNPIFGDQEWNKISAFKNNLALVQKKSTEAPYWLNREGKTVTNTNESRNFIEALSYYDQEMFWSTKYYNQEMQSMADARAARKKAKSANETSVNDICKNCGRSGVFAVGLCKTCSKGYIDWYNRTGGK